MPLSYGHYAHNSRLKSKAKSGKTAKQPSDLAWLSAFQMQRTKYQTLHYDKFLTQNYVMTAAMQTDFSSFGSHIVVKITH